MDGAPEDSLISLLINHTHVGRCRHDFRKRQTCRLSDFLDTNPGAASPMAPMLTERFFRTDGLHMTTYESNWKAYRQSGQFTSLPELSLLVVVPTFQLLGPSAPFHFRRHPAPGAGLNGFDLLR